VTTLVVRLIIGNEENQCRLLNQLSLTLRDQFNWTESRDDLPNGAPPSGPIDPDLIEISRALIREEQGSAEQLRASRGEATAVRAVVGARLMKWTPDN
jgi:hypothetical protein